MKCELLKEGILYITAETELEAYALSKWTAENSDDGNIKPNNITIDWSLKTINKQDI